MDTINAAEFKVETGIHREQDVLFIFFPYNRDLIEQIKQLLPVKWSASKGAWYVPDRQQFRLLFKLAPKVAGKKFPHQSSQHYHRTKASG